MTGSAPEAVEPGGGLGLDQSEAQTSTGWGSLAWEAHRWQGAVDRPDGAPGAPRVTTLGARLIAIERARARANRLVGFSMQAKHQSPDVIDEECA